MASGINIDARRGVEKLNAVAEAVGARPLLEAIGAKQLRWVNDNFKFGGLEKPWQPLKPATIARRRGNDARILQDTGRLRGSYTMKVGTNDTVSIGTEIIYARTHEDGDPSRNIPQRKMLPSQRLAERLALEVVEAVIDRIRQRAGLR